MIRIEVINGACGASTRSIRNTIRSCGRELDVSADQKRFTPVQACRLVLTSILASGGLRTDLAAKAVMAIERNYCMLYPDGFVDRPYSHDQRDVLMHLVSARYVMWGIKRHPVPVLMYDPETDKFVKRRHAPGMSLFSLNATKCVENILGVKPALQRTL